MTPQNLERLLSRAINNALNEQKWVYDSRTGGMRPKDSSRPEDDINLMSRRPSRSGYVVLFQNRVNIHSVGNLHGKQVMWYDAPTRTLSEDRDSEETYDWGAYQLPHYGRPQGWMYKDDFMRLGYR